MGQFSMEIYNPPGSLLSGNQHSAILATPITANAQFGGLASKLTGGSSNEASVSSADGSAFLTNALRSTKNVMISAALLSQALTDRSSLASKKAEIDAITNAQSFKEVNAHQVGLESNLKILSDRKDLTADLTASYQAGSAEQKRIIGLAVANLAIGVFRNVKLAAQAPTMVKGVSSNPQLMGRIGEFKQASTLLAIQGKGLGTIGTALPKLMTAIKVKAPVQSEATEPQPIAL